MAVYKQRKSKYWSYKFVRNSELIRKSTKQTNKRVAETMEAAHKTAPAKGEVGIRDHRIIPTLREFSSRFVAAIETQYADKPATVAFYKSKLSGLLKYDRLASSRLDAIDEEAVPRTVPLSARVRGYAQANRTGERLCVPSRRWFTALQDLARPAARGGAKPAQNAV